MFFDDGNAFAEGEEIEIILKEGCKHGAILGTGMPTVWYQDN